MNSSLPGNNPLICQAGNHVRDGQGAFSYNKKIENDYNRVLNGIARKTNAIINSYDLNKPQQAVELLKRLQNYANELYGWSKDYITRLVYSLDKDEVIKWKRHAAAMSARMRKTLERTPTGALLQQFIDNNVGLIQSVPLKAAEKIQAQVLENLKTGVRAEELAKQIQVITSLSENRAKLIARTETARMSTALTKTRSEELEIGWYIWRSSHDARVRSSHRLMDVTLVAWGNPASPEELNGDKRSYGHYHPGEIFNCRCFAQPLIRLTDIDFPAKIYIDGVLKRINKLDFARISAGQIPMAA